MQIYKDSSSFENIVNNIRSIIPFLNNSDSCSYFDNSATALKPQAVVDAVVEYYNEYPANVHRATYKTSIQASEQYESSKQTIKDFLSADTSYELIFTSGMTEASNLIASAHRTLLTAADTIALTELEHHSHFLPWYETAHDTQCSLSIIPILSDGSIDYQVLQETIQNCSVLAISGMSNVTGYRPPLEDIRDITTTHGCKLIIDAAQLMAHEQIDLSKTPYDAVLFSAHKLGGPTGIGGMCIKKSWLDTFPNVKVGGGTIQRVEKNRVDYYSDGRRFEAGTPNIAGAIGFERIIAHFNTLGWDFITQYEQTLRSALLSQLQSLQGIRILGNAPEIKVPIVSFVADSLHAEDISFMLNQQNIYVRSGFLCAQPLLESLGVSQVVRISAFHYNTMQELNVLQSALESVNSLK